MARTASKYASIVILYRAPDTLDLYGIPYAMRYENQQPGDLWRSTSIPDTLAQARGHYGKFISTPGPRPEWIRLDERAPEVKRFLAPYVKLDLIPQRPNEWTDLSQPEWTDNSGQASGRSRGQRPWMERSYRITTQAALRDEFWAFHPHPKFSRGSIKSGTLVYPTDTRVAFVDFVDYLARNGDISEALAARATLSVRAESRRGAFKT